METSNLTARQYWDQVRANPNRAKFGFGKRPAIVNIDVQRAYTDLDAFKTAYETDPRQIEHINALSGLVRDLGGPVVWTYVAYLESGIDAGTWGTRTNTPDSLQNIKHGSERAQFDPRADIQPADIVMHKRMASPFFETNLWSLLTFQQVDTLIITGGSTSGCVRACVIDSLSRGYRSIVPEQCVADKHEIPHFANLADIMLKYGDVESVDYVADQLKALRA
ncbi:isochorismatase [Stenotrophomonas ginsengisoli]|uniref:Isochorismatase n=2 Tax=Stenotrophomonas ginsengisoli TaxID=336566 RepID=A0A0R0DCP0_9GAMM|nr:isochorismatase [Stenotrophomonas ginsengisoli]